jgi:hypothetical protein
MFRFGRWESRLFSSLLPGLLVRSTRSVRVEGVCVGRTSLLGHSSELFSALFITSAFPSTVTTSCNRTRDRFVTRSLAFWLVALPSCCGGSRLRYSRGAETRDRRQPNADNVFSLPMKALIYVSPGPALGHASSRTSVNVFGICLSVTKRERLVYDHRDA